MDKLSFTEFSSTDSLELRREKLNDLLSYTIGLESRLTQFSNLFAFMKTTYNSKPYFFDSVTQMSNCKFLQNNFVCVCLISEDDTTYLRYYRITNSESSTSDGDAIVDIISDSTLKAVKIPDLFGIEALIRRVNELEALVGGDYDG